MPFVGKQHYEVHGQGEPLVLVHGATLNHRMWDAQLESLGKKYQLILPDLRGHGESKPTTEGKFLAEDLALLLDHLHLESAIVGGHSLGGSVATSFALTYASRCRALIIIDSFLPGYRLTAWQGTGPYAQKAKTEGLAAALSAWLDDPLFASAMRSPAAEKLRELVSAYKGWGAKEGGGSMWPPGKRVVERLGELAMPTLVLLGELDLKDMHLQAAQLRSAVKGCKLVMIPGAGHMSPMERPDEVNKAIKTFLKETFPKK